MVNKTMANKRKKRIKTKKIWGGNLNNQDTTQNVIEPPTVIDNAKKAFNIGLQLGNNVAALGLDKLENKVEDLSKSIGIDPNKSVEQEISRIGDKVVKIQNALDTPEGKRAMQNASNLLTNISKDIIAPAVEKGITQVIDHSEPILTKSQNAVFDLVSASPLGALVDIPKFLLDGLAVVENTTAMASDISETAEQTVDKIKDKQNELNSVWTDLSNVIQNGTTSVHSGLSTIENSVNNYGKDIVKNVNSNDAIKSMQNMKQESIKIGGRIHKAQLDFLKPRINSKQMLKQYGGKWNTKRRYKKCT
jgi:hypothetical protein